MVKKEICEVIDILFEQCHLGEIIQKPTRVSGGLLNRMYHVKTQEKEYAVKLLNPEVMKRKEARKNHLLAETISNIAKRNGVSCLPAKIIDGNIIQNVENYHFLVFDWLDGKAITDEELSIEKSVKVAKELAKLHQIDFSECKEKCQAYYDTTEINWQYYIDQIENVEICDLLKENMQKLIALDKEAIQSLEKISYHMVISHRDLDLPNVLWDNQENPVLIDWESSGLVNPTMEVIDTAWNWSGGQKYFDSIKFQAFLEAYQNNGGILTDYSESFKADFKAKFGWLEYNLKRVAGIECSDEEEKQLGETEVVRTIDEINQFDLHRIEMSIK